MADKKTSKEESTKSGRSYSDRTLKILWGRSAGRCAVPSCRIELYLDATEHDPMVPIGDIAHLESSSDSGPRANITLAKKERDEYDNLILLCKVCHARFDGQKNSYTVDYIRQLRNDHEAWVRSSLPERGRSTIGWITLLLQGQYPFDIETTINALLPDFPDGKPVIFKAEPDKEPWESIQMRLSEQIDSLLGTSDSFDFRLAVFPLAPVSACLALGYYLTNRPRVRLFQYHRDEQSWSWPKESMAVNDISITGIPEREINDSGEIAICFNLTAPINQESLRVLPSLIGEIQLTVPNPSTSWLQHPDQLKYLAKASRNIFELCAMRYPNVKLWHIFFAGPAPAGVTIGQQLNPTMCPPIQLYEFKAGQSPPHTPSIVLGT